MERIILINHKTGKEMPLNQISDAYNYVNSDTDSYTITITDEPEKTSKLEYFLLAIIAIIMLYHLTNL